MAGYPVPPVYISNYTNDESAKVKGGTNDFRVESGMGVAGDSVPLSPAMRRQRMGQWAPHDSQ